MPEPIKAIAHRYYPKLSEVITMDDMPEFLSFAKVGLTAVFDKIYYKNLQYSKSYRGDAAFYSLDIVSRQIGIDLPFGLRFVLNPDEDGDTTISSFPVTLEYQWEILAYLRAFKINNFAFTPLAFYDLGLKIFRVTEDQVLAHTLNYFVEPATENISKFQQLVDDINLLYPAADLTLPIGADPTVESVVALIKANANIPVGISALMFALYLLDDDLDVVKTRLQEFYNLIVPEGIEEFIRKLIIPKAKATLELSAAIEFPNNILQPVTETGTPIASKTKFKFAEALLYVDTEAGIGYQVELAGSLIPEFNQIANTGLIISFTNAKLDLSSTTNIPEADAAGYSADFVGLYIQSASITFTRFGTTNATNPSASIFAENLLVGTGGVTGTIGIEAGGGALYRDFGGFAAELTEFSLTFRQNSIISSTISGFLTIKGFKQGGNDAVLAIEAEIKDDGDFTITAKPLLAPLTITLPNVFEIQITSLQVGKVGNRYYIEVGGKLSFIADIPVLGDVLPKGIDLTGFRIWDNGDFEFPGGRLKLKKAFKLNVGPVRLEVAELALAPYKRTLNGVERKYKSFAFDGMINTGQSGVNVSGNGIKYYFSVDGLEFDHFIRIAGITIDIAVPGNVARENAAFLLNGTLSMKEPNPEIPASSAAFEYAGDVTFSLPRLKFAGTAGMRLNPTIPAFLVDIGMEMAKPIPIGSTGLGIYGFRGLIGQHYMPDKNGHSTWLEYYRAPPPGVSIDKFESRPGTSLGAGMAMATTFDSGRVFTSKVFLLLGLPDVFLLEGQAGILRKRIGLNDEVDPPFTALIIIGDRSIRANLAVDYKLPDEGALKGSIMSLQGALDMAFFFNNSSGWYINIGKDNPESERVRAKVLTLFNAHAYLMLSMQGIKAGAGAKFDFNKSFGPISVGIGAFLNLGGFISFKPFQIGGFIQLGGYAYIKVWKVKLGVAIATSLAVEAPHPFNIIGSLKLSVNLPWPIKKITLSIDFAWRISKNRQPLLEPIAILQLPDAETSYAPAIATNILTGETFELNYVLTDNETVIPAPDSADWNYNFTIVEEAQNVTVPLDSFIDIELLKPVKPGVVSLGGSSSQLPTGYKELLPPVKGIDAQVRHEFELVNVNIKAWRDTGGGTGQWVDYNVYESVTAIVNSNIGPGAINLHELKAGYWQFMEPGRFNKIRLLSQNMFSYSSKTLDGASDLDGRNFKRKDIFCFDAIRKEMVVNWNDETAETAYPNNVLLTFKGVEFTFIQVPASAKYHAGWNNESLFLNGSAGSVRMDFPEPATYISLEFGANENNVAVHYVKDSFSVGDFGQVIPEEEILSTAMLLSTEQDGVITYDDAEQPVDRIILEINPKPALDYTGDLLIGGHYELEGTFPGSDDPLLNPQIEAEKGLIFVSLYNRSFTAAEVLSKDYRTGTGIVGQWPMETNMDSVGSSPGILRGNPETIPGYYENNSGTIFLHYSYYFTSNDDGLFVPYKPALKIENQSFAFEATAIFDPGRGISTLLQKLETDAVSNYRKGFTLHLIQELDDSPEQVYPDLASVPSFTILLTVYNELDSYSVQASAKYTVDCETSTLSRKQYKPVLVSVNRSTNTLEIFIEKVSRFSGSIPDELSVYDSASKFTFLNELRYLTVEKHASIEDNQITEATVIDEVEILDNGINKVIQPVWRPDTTFAVQVSLQDRVNGNVGAGGLKNYIFGFKTAGPVGHFHQQNKRYQQLAAEDRADEFKLAKLHDYIDLQRSYPDAQGRFDLSKPVFYQDPQIRLFFTEPYIYAMFSDWAAYQSLPPVSSKLEIKLLDPEGNVNEQQLTWEPMQEVIIDDSNADSLPEDLKIIYQLNKAASGGSCNSMINPIKKRLQKGYYQFDDLLPDQLYTAIFNSVYPADPLQSKVEVHKYNFKTSRYANFLQQASSFVLDNTPGDEVYAIDSRTVSFSQADINDLLKPLVNDLTDDDPSGSLQYAEKFDRLLYGGLEIRTLEGPQNTMITLLINVDPLDEEIRQLLAILIRNPEPFNEPKLTQELLADTLQMTLTVGSEITPPADFIYIYSADTSGTIITNTNLNIPVGNMKLDFRYKVFNGEDYNTLHEDYSSAEISLADYF